MPPPVWWGAPPDSPRWYAACGTRCVCPAYGTQRNEVARDCSVGQRAVFCAQTLCHKGLLDGLQHSPTPTPVCSTSTPCFAAAGAPVEFLDLINQACLVMLYETGIVPREHAVSALRWASIPCAMRRALKHTPQGCRATPLHYLDYEPRLVAVVGPDASRLHSGRSRAGHCLHHRAYESA